MRTNPQPIALDILDDHTLALRAAARDPEAVRLITQRNNQRLFRTAWSVLKNHAEAEDVVQEAYAKAFAAMARFRGDSSLSTWLIRIVLNEAIGRKRVLDRRSKFLQDQGVAELDEHREQLMAGSSPPSPEAHTLRMETKAMLERAVGQLPDAFRSVFVLRDIEGMSVAETAAALEIGEATVKTRHWRARQRLQELLDPEFKSVFGGTIAFAGVDCEALTARVLARLGL
jgi:RNA polymerase sigma-70 factor (ECF subfamily)